MSRRAHRRFPPGSEAVFDDVEFHAEVDRACSWWNAKATVPSAYVLEHEQIHFALTDLTLEVFPAKGATLHLPLLHELGVYIGEIFWLEDLAADCAADGRYEFFLAAQPLNLTRAVASPINPVAIK